jgi:UDP-N-acetylmuramoyl-tripeptide--D-alanyl-D-alanine ligase
MPEFAPDFLAQVTGGRWTAPPVAPVCGFNFDTRKLRAGEVFVAVKTAKRDGHQFVAQAQGAGAAAAIVATADAAVALPQLVVGDPLAAMHAIAREHRRAFRRPVVGISGSAGKTSTKDLLALLLGGASCGVVATEGNLNNHLGVPLTLTRLDPAQHSFAVIEAGISAPGEMQPLAAMIAPDVSIVTLVAPAHTEELGGLEGVAREKAALAAATQPGGVAIFPAQAAEFAAFRELAVPTLVVERADVVRPATVPAGRAYFAVSHRAERTGISLASGSAQPVVFALRRVSDGMAQNAALALCAARRLGVPDAEIQQRLARWQPAKLRGEIREERGRWLYLDCYNANPASMVDALGAFDALAPADEPRLYVLGCMEELGAEAAAHHRTLGRSVRLRTGDYLFVIGTHAHDVCAGVLDQGNFTRQIQIVSSLDTVTAALEGWRGAVFVKGSRRYQLENILEVQTSLPLSC